MLMNVKFLALFLSARSVVLQVWERGKGLKPLVFRDTTGREDNEQFLLDMPGE